MKAGLIKYDMPISATIRIPVLEGYDADALSEEVAVAQRRALTTHQAVMGEFVAAKQVAWVQEVLDKAGEEVAKANERIRELEASQADLEKLGPLIEAICDADIASLPADVRDARLAIIDWGTSDATDPATDPEPSWEPPPVQPTA